MAAPRTFVVAAVAASASARFVRLARRSSEGALACRERVDLPLEGVEPGGLDGDLGVAVHDELRQVAVGAQVAALGGLEAHGEHDPGGGGDDGHDETPGEARAPGAAAGGLLPGGCRLRLLLGGVDGRGGARHRRPRSARALRADTIVP